MVRTLVSTGVVGMVSVDVVVASSAVSDSGVAKETSLWFLEMGLVLFW